MPTNCTDLSPGVSIVIVSAHESHRLLSTLRSIPLDVHNVEVILVVPKSDTGAQAIVSESGYLGIRIYHDLGRGVYQAMNIGISKALHTHILFLNTGDRLIGLDQLTHCLSEIENDPTLAYIFPIEASWSEDLTSSLPDLRKFLSGEKGSYVSHQGVLFLKAFLSQEGRFDERFKIAADYKQLCSLYYARNYSTLNSKLVSIEYPKISAKFNRRGRIETILIAFFYLKGLLRLRALANRARREVHDLLK